MFTSPPPFTYHVLHDYYYFLITFFLTYWLTSSVEGLLSTVHIVPELSEGTWLSSLNVMHFFGSSGAKDQLPGH